VNITGYLGLQRRITNDFDIIILSPTEGCIVFADNGTLQAKYFNPSNVTDTGVASAITSPMGLTKCSAPSISAHLNTWYVVAYQCGEGSSTYMHYTWGTPQAGFENFNVPIFMLSSSAVGLKSQVDLVTDHVNSFLSIYVGAAGISTTGR